MFFKGYGTAILFVTVWFYTLDKLDLTDLLSAIGIFLIWRTFISIGLFSALFSWVHYQLQWQTAGNMAVYLDSINISPGSIASQTRGLQLNTILGATKSLFGYIILASIGILLYILFHHFGRTRYSMVRVRLSISGRIRMSRRNMRLIKKQIS